MTTEVTGGGRFQLNIEGFSGPLDLLCHMVEHEEINISEISVSEVVTIYSAYLLNKGNMPINRVAEFIAAAARLVLRKTESLLPRYDPEPDILIDEEEDDVATLLERYRPYRKAVQVLASCKEKADRRRFRMGEDPGPYFDVGDLYSLSLRWLNLITAYYADRAVADADFEDLDDWEDEGMPAPIPDEVQVEKRMERVMERLEIMPEGLTLKLLLENEPGRSALVVTLLALLELSRRNYVLLVQKELFGDVRITARK